MAVAVVAIGTFALPSTVSLFSGQHTWYDLSGRENNVPCEKCHADIAEEMEQLVGPHTNETGYGRFKCEYCHRVFPIDQDEDPTPYGGDGYDGPDQNINQTLEQNYNFTYASANGTTTVVPGKEAHAASTVPCMYCHSGHEYGGAHAVGAPPLDCKSCHDPDENTLHGGRFRSPSNVEENDCIRCHGNAHTGGVYRIPPAGGFNLTTNASDTGSNAAHKTFVQNAISNLDMEDANEACIACHTGIPVNITWKHAHDLEFTAYWDGTLELPPTHFNVSDWQANGTVTNHSYGYGNGTGSTSSSGWYQGV